MLSYLQTVRERPAWQPTPKRVKEQLKAPLPIEPQSAAEAYQDMAPAPLNIVCFRYQAADLDDEALNRLNQAIMFELHEQGLAVPTYPTLDGKFALRVAHTNHRTRREDFDLLAREVVRLGGEIRGEIRPGQ